jgi:molybdenum cofactor cytidylyltransferase
MGTLKPLLPFGSGSVIGQVVRSLQASPIDAVLVVVGHRGDEIRQHLSDFGFAISDFGLLAAACPNPKSQIQNPKSASVASVSIVPNANYPRGMLTSVQAGVVAADPATTLFLIALADQPSIPAQVIGELIHAFEERRPGMLVPTFDGRRGHPLLIDARYREEVAALDPELGLRSLLQRHPAEVLLRPVTAEAVIRDMDTRAEYEAELQRWRAEQGSASEG